MDCSNHRVCVFSRDLVQDQMSKVVLTDYGNDSVKVFSADGVMTVVSRVSSEVNGTTVLLCVEIGL